MPHVRIEFLHAPVAVLMLLSLISEAASQTVWTGLTFEFTRLSDVTPPPADVITPGVHLTRGLTGGLYNAAPGKDAFYTSSTPTGTRWATAINNPGKAIAATNHADLQFATWINAYGGSGIGNVIEGRDAVLHLIEEDIYLDFRMTDWIDGRFEGGGGGFTYLRAVAPAPPPMPTGDYNGNGQVDAADYVAWRSTLDQMVMPGENADGDGSGRVDAGDYDYWRARFGQIVNEGVSSIGSPSAAVPEPPAIALFLVLGAIRLTRLHRCRHN